MTEKAVELLYKSIIQHLAGNRKKSEDYALQAKNLSRRVCVCGRTTVPCRYSKKHSRLCTSCGLVWQQGKAVKKCLTNRRPA